MVTYRTRTYIAGDLDHDKDAVDQLHKAFIDTLKLPPCLLPLY